MPLFDFTPVPTEIVSFSGLVRLHPHGGLFETIFVFSSNMPHLALEVVECDLQVRDTPPVLAVP